MPLFGPPNVEKMKKKKDIKGLLKALTYQKSPGVRADAVKALGSVGGSEIVPHLIEALNDESILVRKAAVVVFWNIKDERAVEPLIGMINDEDTSISHYAVLALNNQKDKRALEPLMSLFKSKGQGMIKLHRDALVAALASIGQKDLTILKQLLLNEKAAVRQCAAEVLDRMKWQGDETETGAAFFVELGRWFKVWDYGVLAVNPLANLLQSDDEAKRARAVEELGKIKDERIEGLITPMLDDPAESVRLEAVKVLEKTGSTAVKEAAVKTKEGLGDYLDELAQEKKEAQAAARREQKEHRKALIQKSICKVKFNEKSVTLDPGDGKLSLIDLFLKNEPAIIYELRDVENKLNDFDWLSENRDFYPVAVVFGANKKGEFTRNFFRMSGTFTYKGQSGTLDDRQRIYYVSINKKGILSLHGDIEGEEGVYRSEGPGYVYRRRKSVYDPECYGLTKDNFEEVMKDSIYTIRLLDINMETVFAKFARHGTTFYTRETRDVWRGDSNTYAHFHKPK